MNKYKTSSYFILCLTSLVSLAAQGSSTHKSGNSHYQPSIFVNQAPLKLPDFESGALHLAENTTDSKTEPVTPTAKPKTEGGHKGLAAQATNPIANLMQFQIQNSFIPESYESSGYSNAFVLQPVIPIKLSKDGFFPFMVTRTTLPVLTTPNFDGPVDGTTGLGDLTFLALPVHQQKMGSWGAMWGVGLATVIPTATDHRTGSGKFSLGPSAVAILSPSKSIQTGVLAYHLWDVAGDSNRTYVSKTLFQPVFNYHFKELFGQTGWYAGLGDELWSYDWNAQQLDLPISVRIGRVFKAGKLPLNVFFEPFGRPVHNGPTGKYGFKLNVTFLFPE